MSEPCHTGILHLLLALVLCSLLSAKGYGGGCQIVVQSLVPAKPFGGSRRVWLLNTAHLKPNPVTRVHVLKCHVCETFPTSSVKQGNPTFDSSVARVALTTSPPSITPPSTHNPVSLDALPAVSLLIIPSGHITSPNPSSLSPPHHPLLSCTCLVSEPLLKCPTHNNSNDN